MWLNLIMSDFLFSQGKSPCDIIVSDKKHATMTVSSLTMKPNIFCKCNKKKNISIIHSCYFNAGLMKGDGERYIQARIVMNVYSCLGNPQGNKFMPYPRGVQTCLPTMYTSSLRVIRGSHRLFSACLRLGRHVSSRIVLTIKL